MSCSVVLALYGATFGVVKSKIWLITVLMSMAFSTFLVQPVKAVALAMVLSYIFKVNASSVKFELQYIFIFFGRVNGWVIISG